VEISPSLIDCHCQVHYLFSPPDSLLHSPTHFFLLLSSLLSTIFIFPFQILLLFSHILFLSLSLFLHFLPFVFSLSSSNLSFLFTFSCLEDQFPKKLNISPKNTLKKILSQNSCYGALCFNGISRTESLEKLLSRFLLSRPEYSCRRERVL